jgi:hypothetical protein
MNDTKVGQRISSNDTRTLKRAFLVGVVVINAGVFLDSIVDGSLVRHPFTHMEAFAIILGVWVLFFKKWKIFGLADAIIDCGDHLSVRKGKVEQIIPFSSIASVSASSMFNVNRVKVEVAAQLSLGELSSSYRRLCLSRRLRKCIISRTLWRRVLSAPERFL